MEDGWVGDVRRDEGWIKARCNGGRQLRPVLHTMHVSCDRGWRTGVRWAGGWMTDDGCTM
eukprot:3602267-Rhodomonas_salina.2